MEFSCGFDRHGRPGHHDHGGYAIGDGRHLPRRELTVPVGAGLGFGHAAQVAQCQRGGQRRRGGLGTLVLDPESGNPARSIACCSFSVVSTVGHRSGSSSETLVGQRVTASQTRVKCGVGRGSRRPVRPPHRGCELNSWATTGISMAPCTRTTVGSAIPQTAATLRAPSSNASQIWRLRSAASDCQCD